MLPCFVLALNAPSGRFQKALPARLKCRTPRRVHISLTSATSFSASNQTSNRPGYSISLAARSVFSTTSIGSLPGTMVVMKATLNRASG